jgi:molecular chaperone HtpG
LTGDQAKDAHLIGQFGVGFYSSFIIADKVTVVSRRAGVEANQACAGNPVARAITPSRWSKKPTARYRRHLHLREGEDEFLGGWKLKSDHPQVFRPHHPADRDEEGEWTGKGRAGDDRRRRDGQPGLALWARPKSEITDEQYKEFYKHVAHDFEDPLAWTHARVEGKQEYTQLLYIPARAPFDLWDRNARHGIKLYVRRVFIMDDAEQLMPLYMRFVRGVVDSSDLPLNVSREILQQSGHRRHPQRLHAQGARHARRPGRRERQGEVRQVLEGLRSRAQGRRRRRLRQQGAIAGLLRFASTHNDTPERPSRWPTTSAHEGRPGEDLLRHRRTFNAAKNSPHLEIFRKKGIEVLLLSDRVDEWVTGHLTEFDGKQLQSVAKGGLDLGKLEDEAEKKEAEKAADEYKELLEKVKTSLGDKVKDVRVTYRLTDSPSCLVADEHDPVRQPGAHPQGRRAAGASEQADPRNQPEAPGGAASEVRGNAFRRLGIFFACCFEQATLAEGGQLDDPAGFVKRINDLMMALSVANRFARCGEFGTVDDVTGAQRLEMFHLRCAASGGDDFVAKFGKQGDGDTADTAVGARHQDFAIRWFDTVFLQRQYAQHGGVSGGADGHRLPRAEVFR